MLRVCSLQCVYCVNTPNNGPGSNTILHLISLRGVNGGSVHFIVTIEQCYTHTPSVSYSEWTQNANLTMTFFICFVQLVRGIYLAYKKNYVSLIKSKLPPKENTSFISLYPKNSNLVMLIKAYFFPC